MKMWLILLISVSFSMIDVVSADKTLSDPTNDVAHWQVSGSSGR